MVVAPIGNSYHSYVSFRWHKLLKLVCLDYYFSKTQSLLDYGLWSSSGTAVAEYQHGHPTVSLVTSWWVFAEEVSLLIGMLGVKLIIKLHLTCLYSDSREASQRLGISRTSCRVFTDQSFLVGCLRNFVLPVSESYSAVVSSTAYANIKLQDHEVSCAS